MFVNKNQHKYVSDIAQVGVGVRKTDRSLSFFMLKWHKALKTFKSGCKSRWPSQSFLAPASPTPTACAIKSTNQRQRAGKRSGFIERCSTGWGGCTGSSPSGLLGLPAPNPGLVIAPVWASGGRPLIPGDSPALWSVGSGALGAGSWPGARDAGGSQILGSPARSPSTEHLTRRRPPHYWNAIGSLRLVVLPGQNIRP